MYFIAAIFDWSLQPDSGGRLGLMAASRRLAPAHDLEQLDTPAGRICIAGAAHASAVVGDVTAIVINCEAIIDPTLSALAAEAAKQRSAPAFHRAGALQTIIVDRECRQVTIVTDRFAIGQIFYFGTSDELVMSSDLAALVSDQNVSAEVDDQAIYDYLFFHCIPAPKTIYRTIKKFEPAGVVNWHDGTIKRGIHWSPDFAKSTDAAPAAAALLNPLEQATADRSLNKVGAFLSGGLDSSTVAGMLTRSVAKAPTFTIGFSAAEYDESEFARVAADHFDTTHHEYFVTPRDIADMWPKIAGFYSEPFGNSSVIPTYYCARFAREHGIDTLLAGDGGDELFGGNERYTAQNVFERYFGLPKWLRGVLETGYRLAPILARLPITGKGQRYIQQAKMGLPDRLQSYNFLNRFAHDAIFCPDWLESVDQSAPWQAWRERYAAAGDVEQLHAMLFLDWKFTLADNDLVKVSTMCELAGTAVRYPMLDGRVVDFAASIPAPAINPGGRLRGFYKDGTRQFLPEQILNKSKHGFGLPFGIWMRDDPTLNELAETALRAFAKRGIVRAAFIDDAIRLLRSDAPGYYGELIWIIVTLEFWMQAHKSR